jgi:hypothetical protein
MAGTVQKGDDRMSRTNAEQARMAKSILRQAFPGTRFSTRSRYDCVGMDPMINPSANENEIKAFLTGRKEAGRRIDLNNVEVTWCYAQVLDPYGVIPDLTDEEYCVGRSYLAHSPASDGWVSFYDLPKATAHELWRRIEAGGFPEVAPLTLTLAWPITRQS